MAARIQHRPATQARAGVTCGMGVAPMWSGGDAFAYMILSSVAGSSRTRTPVA